MTMTIKELIEELECYDKDNRVWIKVDGNQTPVHSVDFEEDDEFTIIIS